MMMQEKITIDLPFPPSDLLPNNAKSLHWAALSRTKKKYRADCHTLAKMQRNKWQQIFGQHEGDFKVDLTFFRPAKYHYDDDNLESAFKAGRDGLAEAMGVNDRRFKTSKRIADETVTLGMVRVTIEKMCGGL